MTKRFQSPMLIGIGILLTLSGVLTWETFYSQAQTVGGCQTFPQTNHTVCGKFLAYWQSHGGLAQQGYPISEVSTETSDLNGQQYTVQYFERAVFELHPKNQPPYDVLLSQLGTLRAEEKYPIGFPPSEQTPFYENRTGPIELLQSFYNAINRKEYQRAYGYFEAGSNVQPYAQFAQGYADTASVMFMSGAVTTEGAVGSTYASVPVVITATHTDGSVHTFYGCYTLRRTNPGIDPNPNATLWRIYDAHVQPAPDNMSTDAMLMRGCKK
jgi:hypothetical protein